MHVLAQQVQLFQSVPVNKNENWESFPVTISPSNVPEAVEGGIGRQVQHVVVQLQTLDVVEVVEEVLGNALQSVGAQVERVEALLEAAERLLGEKINYWLEWNLYTIHQPSLLSKENEH